MPEFSEPERFTPINDPRPEEKPWPPIRWPIPTDPVLIGKTVTLTPLDPQQDTQELFAALNHDKVWAHVPGQPRSVEEFFSTLAGYCANPQWHPWTIRINNDFDSITAGTAIGMSSYLDIEVRDSRLEIGFTAYTPQVWGSRVNPETKLLLLTYAFESLGAGRVQLKTDVRNHRSQQAIHRLGATYEGTLRRHFRRADGSVRDSVMFSIIAEEWPEVRDRLMMRTS
ncbi:MAG: GNAT family N-acetyltransferase [Mycobacteriaceae bacterium]